MADNFAWMIERYGHIPNGNRTYYLSRSQPPVFALMVELFEEDGVRGARRYLDHLLMEYDFWMDGAESLVLNQAYRHVVRMPDGSLLNRYWDDRDTPRDESWIEDVETARHSGRPPNEVYRDLRAGAASGWDYSSRWLRDAHRLASIRTTQFIPIDLNAFMFKLESAIANISGLKGDREREALFRQKASDRRAAINRYLWDDESGCFRDYDWRREEMALFSAASIVPLYVGMATHEQAERLAEAVTNRLLTPGGILTTEYETAEQWDKPNGWAPLQWMAIQGFKLYGNDELGDQIARSWLKTVNVFYHQHHKLIEKYHIASSTPREGGGGEYPLQDGFGWTNGVVRRLIGLYGEPKVDEPEEKPQE
jgi:alpha,alpha-trehalase